MNSILSQTGPLVEVEHPNLLQDLHYATTRNFTGRILYPNSKAWLHQKAAESLYHAADALAAKGLKILLLDAYRPASVQRALWAVRPDPMYVADPQKGSDHTRGIAVDITLCDASDLRLDMGTAFDAAEVASHYGTKDISENATRNRELLADTMEASGFVRNPFEWWHFGLLNAENYPFLSE